MNDLEFPKYGEDLTREQYNAITERIWKDHRFARGGRSIKYIDPHWDMRDGMCFAVQFRGVFGNGKINFVGNQSEKSLYERIMNWLDGEDDLEADQGKVLTG